MRSTVDSTSNLYPYINNYIFKNIFDIHADIDNNNIILHENDIKKRNKLKIEQFNNCMLAGFKNPKYIIEHAFQYCIFLYNNILSECNNVNELYYNYKQFHVLRQLNINISDNIIDKILNFNTINKMIPIILPNNYSLPLYNNKLYNDAVIFYEGYIKYMYMCSTYKYYMKHKTSYNILKPPMFLHFNISDINLSIIITDNILKNKKNCFN